LDQPFGDLLNNGAELGIALIVFLTEFVRRQIDLRNAQIPL
jgi:hypothetical protein